MKTYLRIIKFVALGVLGIAGVSLIWIAVARAAASKELERAIAELKKDGQPTTLADLARKPVPPEKNAATYLRRAAEGMEAIEGRVNEAFDTLSIAEQQAMTISLRAPQAVQDALRETFAEHAATIELLEQAAAQKEYDPQIDYQKAPMAFQEDYLETMQDVRQPIRVLNYRVTMLLTDGKREEAFDTCLTMFRLCRHFDERPLLISNLVALAVRGVAIATTNQVLRSGPLPVEAHDKLEAELAKHNPLDAFTERLRGERAFGIDSFREFDVRVMFLSSPGGSADLQDYLALFATIISDARKPYPEVSQWLASRPAAGLTKLIIPALQAAYSATHRTTAQLRSLRILNAVARRNLMAGDNVPPFSELGLPKEVLVDPYNDQKMLATGDADDLIIYAVGSNLKDDGGQVNNAVNGEYLDVGVGPKNDE